MKLLSYMKYKRIYIKPSINLLELDKNIMAVMASNDRNIPTSPSEGRDGGPNSSGAVKSERKLSPDTFAKKSPF